jgi:AraC-like DNA-binding protein
MQGFSSVLQRTWDHPLTLEATSKELGNAYNSFEVTPLNSDEVLVRTHYSRYGPVVVGDLVCSADVRSRPADSRHGYHLVLPLNGRVETRYLGADIVATGGTATLYRAKADVVFTRWGGGARVVNAQFDLAHVHRALESELGERLGEQILFSPVVDQSTERGASWIRMLLTLNDQLGHGDSVMLNPLVALPFAESLIQGLLLAVDHPYRQMLDRQVRPARPAAVRTAIDLMEAEPGRPLTTSMLAAQAHVSVRTLQESFRRHLGISPMAYLREVRLRRAHEDLRAADPTTTTVSSIAHRWAFTHLGRFAAVYEAAYGEQPARTLRASRYV